MQKSWWLICLALTLWNCARPIADFNIEPGDRTAPAKVNITNKSREATHFQWFFGDGNRTTQPHPEHRYVLSGQYPITLIASKGKHQSKMTKTINIQSPEHCRVLLITPMGDMSIELSDLTPKHRNNFIKLAESGYFNGMLFHRVIPGFMIQGGDPDSKDAPKGKALGMGGPGYQIDAEITPQLIHVKGALSAARMGDNVNPLKKSSGSQFYIVQGAPVTDEMLDQYELENGWEYTPEQRALYKKYGGSPFLDGNYTVFGRVLDGLEVIDTISNAPRDPRDRPLEDIHFQIEVVK